MISVYPIIILQRLYLAMPYIMTDLWFSRLSHAPSLCSRGNKFSPNCYPVSHWIL